MSRGLSWGSASMEIRKPRGMGLWNPTSRKGSEKRGIPAPRPGLASGLFYFAKDLATLSMSRCSELFNLTVQ
jgi:hypothetical protein